MISIQSFFQAEYEMFTGSFLEHKVKVLKLCWGFEFLVESLEKADFMENFDFFFLRKLVKHACLDFIHKPYPVGLSANEYLIKKTDMAIYECHQSTLIKSAQSVLEDLFILLSHFSKYLITPKN